METMLRFMYGYKYSEAVEKGNPRDTPISGLRCHLHVYAAASKYLLPQLTAKALEALHDALARTSTLSENQGQDVFEVVQLLTEYREHNDTFVEERNALISQHLPILMRLRDFRAWLEEANNPLLDLVLGTLLQGLQDSEHEVWTCRYCDFTCFDRDVEHYCEDDPCSVDYDDDDYLLYRRLKFSRGTLSVCRQ
jgi:hypothetical protein